MTVADDGTIEFQINPGSYQVQLRYQATPAFMLGIVISIASLITVVLSCKFTVMQKKDGCKKSSHKST